MNCQHCREIQYETKSSKNKVMLFIFLPFIINPLCIIYDISKISILLIDIGLIVGLLFTIPFILKLSNKEEPLWWLIEIVIKLMPLFCLTSYGSNGAG